MSASGRRPLGNRNATGGSSRRNPAPEPSEKRARTSGRGRPDEEGGDDASTLKKVMFFGTGALILVCLVLLVMKWNVITAPTPKAQPKRVEKREDLEFEAIKDDAKNARKLFNDAMKITDGTRGKAKALQSSIDAMAAARDKYAEMSERPQYQGSDYDQVFELEINRIQQEIKAAREAKAKAMAKE